MSGNTIGSDATKEKMREQTSASMILMKITLESIINSQYILRSIVDWVISNLSLSNISTCMCGHGLTDCSAIYKREKAKFSVFLLIKLLKMSTELCIHLKNSRGPASH